MILYTYLFEFYQLFGRAKRRKLANEQTTFKYKTNLKRETISTSSHIYTIPTNLVQTVVGGQDNKEEGEYTYTHSGGYSHSDRSELPSNQKD